MQREGASGVQPKERTLRGRGRAGSPSTRPTGPTIKDVVEQVEKQVRVIQRDLEDIISLSLLVIS